MGCSKAFIAFLMTLISHLYLCDSADLVAPNSLGDDQYLQEGVYTFLNHGCTLTLKQNEEVILQSQGVDGSCTLTMRLDGELVEARDSDGFVLYTSDTVSVLGGVTDNYMLHLGSDGQLAIERSDGSVVLELNPAHPA